MKRKLTIIVLLLAAFAVPVCAQDAGHLKLAEELLLVMKVDTQMEQAFEQMKSMQMAQMQSMNLSATEEDIAFQNQLMDAMAEEMSWENVKNDYINLYAEVFSPEEIQALLEFFKGPVGQSFIDKMPELMQKSMQLGQKQSMKIMPRLQQMMENKGQVQQ